MAEIYDPAHPLVLEAAYKLTVNLLMSNDFYNAERYGRIAYECHTRPVDPENGAVAKAANDLSMALHGLISEKAVENVSTSIEETEMLARKVLRIIRRIYGIDNRGLPQYLNGLAETLQLKENSTDDDEVFNLVKECLTTHRRFSGPNSMSVALTNHNLEAVYFKIAERFTGVIKRNKFHLTLPYLNEAARISSNLNGTNHAQILERSKFVQWESLKIEFDE
jgi:hypothetical protein